nr:hypothetical protein [Fimbriimonadaceae bacterium]
TDVLDSIYTYFTLGFNPALPAVGLPTNSFSSLAGTSTVFRLQNPDSNNLFLLRTPGQGSSSGTFNLLTPGRYSRLSFLVTGFNGSNPGAYSLNFSNGEPTSGTFTAADNFNQSGFALSGFGRVSRLDGAFANPSGNPRLYIVEVPVAAQDQSRTLVSITFSATTSGVDPYKNIGVFGVSGVSLTQSSGLFSYRVIMGSEFSGGLVELTASDNLRLDVFNDENNLMAEVEVIGFTKVLSPTQLEFDVESSVARPGLSVNYRLFDYDSGTFTVVGGATAALNDVAFTALITNNPGRFVSDLGELKGRVTWAPINDEDPSQDGWLHSLDLVGWTTQ